MPFDGDSRMDCFLSVRSGMFAIFMSGVYVRSTQKYFFIKALKLANKDKPTIFCGLSYFLFTL